MRARRIKDTGGGAPTGTRRLFPLAGASVGGGCSPCDDDDDDDSAAARKDIWRRRCQRPCRGGGAALRRRATGVDDKFNAIFTDARARVPCVVVVLDIVYYSIVRTHTRARAARVFFPSLSSVIIIIIIYIYAVIRRVHTTIRRPSTVRARARL